MKIPYSSIPKIRQKSMIVFDLDGTLTPTKASMDAEMAALLARLLERRKIAIIGGGKYALFREQLLTPLKKMRVPARILKNLFLFPTTATSLYRYRSGWKRVYAHTLSRQEKKTIRKAFRVALAASGYRRPRKVYGTVLEDRGTQITFSALGQDVVARLGKKRGVALKESWLRNHRPMKMKIVKILARLLPKFAVRAAGFTSIDVTKKGIDKAYGLRQIVKTVGVPIRRILFLGDAIFPGGNDYAVVRTGVDYLSVKGPDDTKKCIRALLALIEKTNGDEG